MRQIMKKKVGIILTSLAKTIETSRLTVIKVVMDLNMCIISINYRKDS